MNSIDSTVQTENSTDSNTLVSRPIPKEITEYFSLVKQLEQHPYSQRIFSEVHNASKNLLDRLGVTEERGLKKKRVYEFIDADNEFGLRIEYGRNGKIGKYLSISYIGEGGVKKSLDLITSLGAQNIKELESGDEVSRITRGGMGITSIQGLRKIFEALTKYQPSALLMYNENNLVSKVAY